MTTQEQSNLAKTAVFMLRSEIPLDMMDFIQVPKKSDTEIVFEDLNKCGTTCCFLGFSAPALKLGYIPRSWWRHSEEVFGINENKETHKWNFLFNVGWPNDKKQAATRALILLAGERVPEFTYDSVFNEDLPVEVLIRALGAFVE